jgi:NOL1/NOP2/fmu family ribosome biogenesis protein
MCKNLPPRQRQRGILRIKNNIIGEDKMKIRFLKSKEKKAILTELEKNYGIKEIPYLLLEAGKQKIRGYSGHLSKEELQELAGITNIEIIGTYLISKKDDDARISFDAMHLFKIEKNMTEITKEQLEKWLRGQDLPISNIPRGITILKYQDDLVGIGKSNTEKIFNYVPKERKLKIPLPTEK